MTSNESMLTAFKPLMDDTRSPFLTPSFSAWLLALGGEATTSWGAAWCGAVRRGAAKRWFVAWVGRGPKRVGENANKQKRKNRGEIAGWGKGRGDDRVLPDIDNSRRARLESCGQAPSTKHILLEAGGERYSKACASARPSVAQHACYAKRRTVPLAHTPPRES